MTQKNNPSKKYSLFIGRWQPFHEGHRWLINERLKLGKNVCIAIRDTPIDENNPYEYHEVYGAIWEHYKKEVGMGQVRIICIPDIESVNYGRGVGYDIIEHIPPEDIKQISATKIREAMKDATNTGPNAK